MILGPTSGIDEDDYEGGCGSFGRGVSDCIYQRVSVRRFKAVAAINMTEKPGWSYVLPLAQDLRLIAAYINYLNIMTCRVFNVSSCASWLIRATRRGKTSPDQMPANCWLEVSPKAKWPWYFQIFLNKHFNCRVSIAANQWACTSETIAIAAP